MGNTVENTNENCVLIHKEDSHCLYFCCVRVVRWLFPGNEYSVPYDVCVLYAPNNCMEITLDFVWHSLCFEEQAFLLTVLKMFQGCVPDKHVLFGAGTDYD